MHLASAHATEDLRRFVLGCATRSTLCRLLILIQAILLVPGCAAFKGFPPRVTDSAQDLMNLEDDIAAKAITDCLDAETVQCRNKIIAARMYAIDIQFSEFEEDLFRQTREGGFATTVATLGLTSAAAVAGGIASQILSGTAAFIVGSREAFQKEVLAERTVVAIHTAMRGGRARVAGRLRAGLRQPADEYPLALGLADLNAYYDAGTVLGALVGITEAVGAEAQRAEQQLQREISFNLDAAAERLTASVCGADPNCESPDTSKFDEIRSCWPQAGVPAETFIVDFTLARTLWGEARGEPRLGKEAVAAVVLNRIRRGRPERFGGTIEEVCRKPKQFSCWNPDDPNRDLLERVDRSDPAFPECIEIAERAVDGVLEDPTVASDHYHTMDVSPEWSRGKTPVKTIGRHRFFNNIA